MNWLKTILGRLKTISFKLTDPFGTSGNQNKKGQTLYLKSNTSAHLNQTRYVVGFLFSRRLFSWQFMIIGLLLGKLTRKINKFECIT